MSFTRLPQAEGAIALIASFLTLVLERWTMFLPSAHSLICCTGFSWMSIKVRTLGSQVVSSVTWMNWLGMLGAQIYNIPVGAEEVYGNKRAGSGEFGNERAYPCFLLDLAAKSTWSGPAPGSHGWWQLHLRTQHACWLRESVAEETACNAAITVHLLLWYS